MHTKAVIISSFESEQKHIICLADETGKHIVSLCDILYAKGEGSYTTFYILDAAAKNGCRQILTSHCLGYYEDLLEYGFAKANQSIIFNLLYLRKITRSHEVELKFKHCLIQVTKGYRKKLYELLQPGRRSEKF